VSPGLRQDTPDCIDEECDEEEADKVNAMILNNSALQIKGLNSLVSSSAEVLSATGKTIESGPLMN
jgi:hypothetical protein